MKNKMGSIAQIKEHYEKISNIIVNMDSEELNSLDEDIFHDYYVYHKGLALEKICSQLSTSSPKQLKREQSSKEAVDYTSRNPNIGIFKVVKHAEVEESEREDVKDVKMEGKEDNNEDVKIQLQQIRYEIEELDKDLEEQGQEESNTFPVALLQDDGIKKEEKKPKERLKGYSCLICYKHFPTLEELKLHKVIKHDTTTLVEGNEHVKKCFLCDEIFSSDDELNLHEVGRHMTDIGEYRCSECSVKEIIKNVVIQHFYIVHKKKPMFKCDDCYRLFEKAKVLKNHMEKDHGIDLGKQTCPICRKTIKLTGVKFRCKIEAHCLDKHSGIDFECTICGRKCKDFTSLKNHRHNNHVHERVPKTECKCCGKLLSPERLAVHAEIQQAREGKAQLQWQCLLEGCTRTFYTKSEHYSHVYTRHRLRKCDQCDFETTSSTTAKTHSYSHKSYEERPHKCERCGQRYFKESQLRRHVDEVHLDIRNYKCATCGKAFQTAMKLRTHEKIHKEEYEAFCPECGKGFIQKYNIILHIKKQHPGSEHLLRDFRTGWSNGRSK